MKNLSLSVLAGFLLIGFGACNDDDADNEPVQKGRIVGELRLTDELGVEFTDHSGMSVKANGTSAGFSADGGSYVVENLTSGTYDLSFEKTGFGTYKRFNIQVVEGSNATVLSGIDYLGQKSTTEITNLSANFNPVDSTYSIGCSIAPTPLAGSPRAFRLFFGKTNSVSSQDYQFTPSNTWQATTSSGQITGYPRSQFYNNGFSTGETVYLIAYGESIRTNTYIDPATNKKVFPNVNLNAPSNMVSFVLQ